MGNFILNVFYFISGEGGVKRSNASVRVVVGLSEIVVTETWSEDSS